MHGQADQDAKAQPPPTPNLSDCVHFLKDSIVATISVETRLAASPAAE
jgi:hypothetical protein